MTSITEQTIENKIQALNDKLQELSTKINNMENIPSDYNKQNYYNIDITVRITDTKNVKDCVRINRSNYFISKKLFEEKTIDYNKDSHGTVLKYLETKCHSEMEKMSLKYKPFAELYECYAEFKSKEKKNSTNLTIDHFMPIIESLNFNNEKIKDISIYKLNEIRIWRYIQSDGKCEINIATTCKQLNELLESTIDKPHYITEMLIFIKEK